jgi:outer membrane protein OmpA-like peptidoglycan-associated protein
MRRAAILALGALLAGCATSQVALLDGEAGSPVGAVAVIDPKTEVERGQLTAPNTQTNLGGKSVAARPLKANYNTLLAVVPPPPRVFTLYFVEGTADLTPESVSTLAELRQIVTPASDVQITGHTDTVGDAASNDKLSFDRAGEIRSVLVKEGLPVGNARVTGRGERELRVPTGDGVSEPANRRVDVILR